MGAGPAGLSAALELIQEGTLVTVVEKDSTSVGGISRTLEFMGCRFDVGPQPFMSWSDQIEAVWTEVPSEEIRHVPPLTRILFQGKYLDSPVTLSNASLKLGPVEAARCLMSYAQARMRPMAEPRSFEDSVSSQFGHRLFSILFKPYFEKVWGLSPRDLPANWAGHRINGLDAIARTQVDAFHYPRLGAGQIWDIVAARLNGAGHTVRMGEEVVAVRHARGRVIAVAVRDGAGRPVDILGSGFISAMPIGELIARLVPAAPSTVRAAAHALTYRDLVIVNVVVDKADVFPDQWIAVHDPSVKVGRISNFKNFSPAMVADPGLTGLGMEYFCFDTDGLWAASDAELLDLGRTELVALGICQPDDVKAGMVYRQPKAYPVYDQFYDDHLAVIREWLQRALPNLWVAGRTDTHPWAAAGGGRPAARRIAS